MILFFIHNTKRYTDPDLPTLLFSSSITNVAQTVGSKFTTHIVGTEGKNETGGQTPVATRELLVLER